MIHSGARLVLAVVISLLAGPLGSPSGGGSPARPADVGPHAEGVVEDLLYAASTAIPKSGWAFPTSGPFGDLLYQEAGHQAIDVLSSSPIAGPPGNQVRLAYPGRIHAIYHATSGGSGWQASSTRGDPNAAIVVAKHEDANGATFYTTYMHMGHQRETNGVLSLSGCNSETGAQDSMGSFIYQEVWDYLENKTDLPAGTGLGHQGNLCQSGSPVTHLHFAITRLPDGGSARIDPLDYLIAAPSTSIPGGQTQGILYTGDSVEHYRAQINSQGKHTTFLRGPANGGGTLTVHTSSQDLTLRVSLLDDAHAIASAEAGAGGIASLHAPSLQADKVYRLQVEAGTGTAGELTITWSPSLPPRVLTKPFRVGPYAPWYWKLCFDGEGIERVYLNGRQLGVSPSCNCVEKWLVGFQTVTIEYTEGTSEPSVRATAWPFARDACAAESEPPPEDSAPPPMPVTDAAEYLADVTFSDGSAVSPGQALTKTWRVRNTGTSAWEGFALRFAEGHQMGGPASVDIPSTSPGQSVDASVSLHAPASPGSAAGYWQIVNRDGVHVPGGRLSVHLTVLSPTATSRIAAFSADPPSPSSASTVRIHARVNWWPQFRAMRVRVGDQIIETSEPDHVFEWHAGSEVRGDHTVILEVADFTDTSWSRPERQVLTYRLEGAPADVNHAPDRPTLVANPAYDWYVTIGNAPTLCAQANDPDAGDALEYWFQAQASVGTYDSGWVGGCHSFGAINPGTYEWRAKARDSHGAESDWSDSWHFSVESSGVTINEPTITPSSPSAAERVDFCLTTSGHAGVNIDVRALVNTASDGSASGEWRYLDGYLPGGMWCYSWNTLEYGDGPHRVRFDARAWEPAASDVRDLTYDLQHRRPARPGLVAPIPPSGNCREPIYLNDRTVTFQWGPAVRATGYTLHVDTAPSPENSAAPVYRQPLGSDMLQHTITFDQDYPVLYWRVSAHNDMGTSHSDDQLFGIDRVAPTCAVEPLPATHPEATFPVYWHASDTLSGVYSYDIQYRDTQQGAWQDWLVGAPATKSYDLFAGQSGHAYELRCRAVDHADNTGAYPGDAQTNTQIDPASRPATLWWDSTYAHKRNIVVLNNMSSMGLPPGYPVRLRFDGTTTPTAAEIYNASLSSPKGNDLRIVANDTTELDRLVTAFSPSLIEVTFRTQATIPAGGSDSTTHQVYYGNASPSAPPADINNVLQPSSDGNTVGLWHMAEGSGSTIGDASGGNHHGTCGVGVWTSGKFDDALEFPGGNGALAAFVPASDTLRVNAFTFEAWAQRTGEFGRPIAGQGEANEDRERWAIHYGDGGDVGLAVWASYGTSVDSGSGLLQRGVWQHIAVTFDGYRTVRFYLNGDLYKEGTLPESGIRWGNTGLHLGGTWASAADGKAGRFAGRLSGVRLSNLARTSFPHGAFGKITLEPSMAVGEQIAPDVPGSADLAALGLTSYRSTDGTTIIEAVVRNQGDAPTLSGFFTNLYVDHLPVGPGDYTGSVHFWVAESITAGQTITLTAAVPDPTPVDAPTLAVPCERSSTVYAQVDSAGAVGDSDRTNNISSAVAICTAAADSYEPDNVWATNVPSLAAGARQSRTLHTVGDRDWLRLELSAGRTYSIVTSDLGPLADTHLYLYAADGNSLIASNDDYGGSLASRVAFSPSESGTYYLLVTHWNSGAGGCANSYTVALHDHMQPPVGTHTMTLPLIVRDH